MHVTFGRTAVWADESQADSVLPHAATSDILTHRLIEYSNSAKHLRCLLMSQKLAASSTLHRAHALESMCKCRLAKLRTSVLKI